MTKNRMKAFSDSVLAIIITIMVLKLEAPKIPRFIAYLISYAYVGIYWTNCHHLFQYLENVSGKNLWKNLFWLFFFR